MTPERVIMESMFYVVDKESQKVDFVLNKDQASLDDNLSYRNRVPKARQLGISTYVLARFAVVCLTQPNSSCVVISHDAKATEKMLAKVHYFLENIKGPKPVLGSSSKNGITFPKTNSTFYIGTAGSRQFGRGDTITHLHCSEVAFWPDPKSIITGLYQAVVPNGEIFEESTGNGVGNYYHRRCMDSYEGKGSFHLHFFNWIGREEYAKKKPDNMRQEDWEALLADVDANLKEDWEEPHLVNNFNVSIEQLLWRRDKLEELDYDLTLFKQEYPCTLEECFQSTSSSLFPLVNYEEVDDWIQKEKGYWICKSDYDNRAQGIYAVGVDVSGGVGKDRSVVQVVDVMRDVQVARYSTDKVPPDMLAPKVAQIAQDWNEAFVTVESNNHGGITLLVLQDIYPLHKLYAHKHDTDNILNYGYRTTSKSKPILINNLRANFNEGFVVRDPMTKDELSTFVEKDNGKLEAEDGCYDDAVMALAVGNMGAMKSSLRDFAIDERDKMVSRSISPFSMEAIIRELEDKRKNSTEGYDGFPIPSQHIDRGRMH